MRLREARVERERLPKHGDSVGRLAGPVAHQSQLVEHARRLVVDREVGLVAGGRAVVAEERSVDVAKELERTRGGGIQLGSLQEVSQRVIQLSAAAVGLAAPEVSEHRVRLQSHGAAEGLDGGRGVAGGQRHLPLIDEVSIVALATGLEEPVRSREAAGQEEQDQQEPFHGSHGTRSLWFQGSGFHVPGVLGPRFTCPAPWRREHFVPAGF